MMCTHHVQVQSKHSVFSLFILATVPFRCQLKDNILVKVIIVTNKFMSTLVIQILRQLSGNLYNNRSVENSHDNNK